jgi:hypothetical protein
MMQDVSSVKVEIRSSEKERKEEQSSIEIRKR